MKMNLQSGYAMQQPGLFARVFRFYMDGFRRMTLGRTLWILIIIKLIIMFGILKLFFFQGFLETKFSTDNQRATYVIEQMTQFVPDTTVPKEEVKND
jgi:hypothetical protein